MHGIGKVAAVTKHHALLLIVTVASTEHRHGSCDARCNSWAVLNRNEPQGQIDAAGDAG